MSKCRYCKSEYQESERTILENKLFFANFDNHPVNRGHLKLIPKRHVDAFSDLTAEELVALRDLIVKAKELIDKKFKPDGYNIGINEGEAAGQTVFHLHVHLIPRYQSDVSDPTGGVRNIISGKGNYFKN